MIKAPPRIIVHSFDPEDREHIERLLELAVKLDIPILLGQGEWFLTKAGHEPLRLQTKGLLVHPDDFFIHASTSSGATQAAKALSFQEAELALLRQLVTNLEVERDAQEVTIHQDRKENEELLREVDRLKALVPAWQHPLPVGSTVAFVNDAEKIPMTINEVDPGGRRYWVKTEAGTYHYHPWSDVEPVAEHTRQPVDLDVQFSVSDVRIDGKPIPLHVDVKETPWKGEPLPPAPKKHPQDVGGYVRRTSSHTTTIPIGEIARVKEVFTDSVGDKYVVVHSKGWGLWSVHNCEPCDPPADPPLELIDRAPEPSA